MAKKEPSSHLSLKILAGLLIGAAVGIAFNRWGDNPMREWILANVIDPVGQTFLRALFMVVVPLVFCSLAVGINNLGSTGNVGRLGWRLILYYMLTTTAAVIIGQVLVSLIKPGVGIPLETIEQARHGLEGQVSALMEKSRGVPESLWPGILYSWVPKNIFAAFVNGDMLAVIFVALLLGMALLKVDKPKSALETLSSFSEASILVVGWIMKFAPLAVGALMIKSVSKFGAGLMTYVLAYMGVVILGYLVQLLFVYGLSIKFLIKIPIREFLKRAFPAMATAFSTSSSNATIPTTIQTLEKRFGVPDTITSFSVPLGATINMDGTALFEIVAAMFVAQVFGIDLSLVQQLTLVGVVIFSSVGVAGVPGGSIPILMSAMAMLGIPAEGIALILGVDRLLDMGRTLVNVTGDLTATLFLARVEKVPLDEMPPV